MENIATRTVSSNNAKRQSLGHPKEEDLFVWGPVLVNPTFPRLVIQWRHWLLTLDFALWEPTDIKGIPLCG